MGAEMTTREQIIAAAKKVDPSINEETVDFNDEDGMKKLEVFYAIAFEAGRVAEREECAKLCEDEACGGSAFNNAASYMSKRIRARSTK